jgi:hypothetical protein
MSCDVDIFVDIWRNKCIFLSSNFLSVLTHNLWSFLCNVVLNKQEIEVNLVYTANLEYEGAILIPSCF